MNEKAIGYIIVFAVLIFISKWFNRWILDKVYESANLTWKDVIEYRVNLRGSTHQSRKLTIWILSVSPNPTKTRKLFTFYHLVSAPSAICLILSIMGLFSHILDGFLDVAIMIVIAFTIVTILISVANSNKRK